VISDLSRDVFKNRTEEYGLGLSCVAHLYTFAHCSARTMSRN